MAANAGNSTKEIVIRAKLDTSDSVSQVEKMKRSLKEGMQGDDIAKRFENINKAIEKGSLSTREMAKAIKQYQAIAIEAGQSSPIGVEALKRAGDLKDRLVDTQRQIRIMATDGKVLNASITIGQTAINSYTAFTGITQLAGKSNKDLLQTMAKMQIVMQTMQAIEQTLNQLRKGGAVYTYALAAAHKALTFATGGATVAVNALRTALLSTGIGAIIVGIGMLIANFEKLTKWIGRVVGAYNEEAEAAIKAGDAAINSSKMATEAIEKEYGRRLRIMKAQGKDTYEYEKAYVEARIKLMQKEIQAYVLKTKIEIANGKLELEDIRERTRTIREMLEKYKDLQTDLTVMQIEQSKKQSEARVSHTESIKRERIELEKLAISYGVEKDALETTMKTREEAREHVDLFAEDVAKLNSVLFESTQNIVGSFGSIFNSLAEMQVRGSAQQKKLALAAIVANQAQAIANAVVAASKSARDLVYDPTGIGRIAIWASTFASITAGIIASIAQAKRLLGESGAESISIPKGSGGGLSGSVGQQQVQETAVGYANPAVQKVIVVEADITRAQQNSNYVNKISTI